MSKLKHSFIQFYMDDWKAGTMTLTRPLRSVYFDVCLHGWDKRRPMTVGEQKLIFADLGQEWRAMVDVLVDGGTIERDEAGAIFSARAVFEGEKSFDAWEAKSRGGKGKNQHSSKSVGTLLQDSSKRVEAEQEQDQDQYKEGEANASPKKAAGPISAPIVQMIVDKWNAVAKPAKLSLMLKLTEERSKRLRSRVSEHGAQAIIEAIDTIPTSPFLMGGGKQGWKMNFDSLLQPETCAKLIEGFYHNEGDGEQSAWLTN